MPNTLTCEKHPLRKAEATISMLRSALSDLVGVSTKKELEAIESVLRSAPALDTDNKIVAINAIHVLIETANE